MVQKQFLLKKVADLVVMDQNLFKVAPTALENVQVAMTVFNGKIVYDRSKTAKTNEKVIEVADGHGH